MRCRCTGISVLENAPEWPSVAVGEGDGDADHAALQGHALLLVLDLPLGPQVKLAPRDLHVLGEG